MLLLVPLMVTFWIVTSCNVHDLYRGIRGAYSLKHLFEPNLVTLKFEAIRSSETSEKTQYTAW